ncbi:MAG: YdhR family protein [Caldilineaceae bacterium]|nr:YdhR family protein [Caldilineaceae bacterium]
MYRRISIVLASVLILSLLVAGAALGREAVGVDPAPAAQSDDDNVTLATAKANVEMVQDGRAIVSARGNRILVDSVPPLGGPNEEINPMDMFLGALGTCGAFVYEAAAQEMRIPLNSLSVGVEADFAPAGMTDGSVNPRVQAFRAAVTADGPSMEEMEALADEWRARCPIYTTLELAAPIKITNRLAGEGTAVLDVTFTYDFDSADEYIAEVSPMAEMFAAVPGLVWKTWTLNPETKRAGAVYLFENPEIRQAYMDGELFGAVKSHPALSDYRIRTYDVMRSESLVTHAPLQGWEAGMADSSADAGMVLDVEFTYDFDSADEYIAAVSPLAEQFAAVPGLLWKVWTLNPETKTAGAAYYFADAEAMQTYMDGELFGAVKSHPALSNYEIATYQVMAPESHVTRAPVNGQ